MKPFTRKQPVLRTIRAEHIQPGQTIRFKQQSHLWFKITIHVTKTYQGFNTAFCFVGNKGQDTYDLPYLLAPWVHVDVLAEPT